VNGYHPGGASVCAGPTTDQQIIRDLFTNCIRAAEILGVDADFRQTLATARSRLAPSQIGKASQLQEWLDDWDMDAPEIHRDGDDSQHGWQRPGGSLSPTSCEGATRCRATGLARLRPFRSITLGLATSPR
jgi:hypothetical protein